jgi:hypothetical protein
VSKPPINVDLELAKTQGRRLQCIVIDAYVLSFAALVPVSTPWVTLLYLP